MRSLFLGKNPFLWLARTVRAKGPVRALKVLWHATLDASWDFVHGTETVTRIPPQNIATDSTNKSQATSYGATRARPLVKLLTRLGLPREGCFLDLGCGKGRVILIAAQYGFRKVVGVDFSEELCGVARKNLEAFGHRRKLDSDVIIVHADVVDYAIQRDETTFFLYDPFSSQILTRVLQNIQQSVIAYPREICLIYNSPRYHDVMERCGLFTESRLFEIGGNEFHVYGNAGIPWRG